MNDCNGRAPGRVRATVVGANTDYGKNPRHCGEEDAGGASDQVNSRRKKGGGKKMDDSGSAWKGGKVREEES